MSFQRRILPVSQLFCYWETRHISWQRHGVVQGFTWLGLVGIRKGTLPHKCLLPVTHLAPEIIGWPRFALKVAINLVHVFVWQNGEQCTCGGDEINSRVDTENANSRTVAAATSRNIVLDVATELQDTVDQVVEMLYTCTCSAVNIDRIFIVRICCIEIKTQCTFNGPLSRTTMCQKYLLWLLSWSTLTDEVGPVEQLVAETKSQLLRNVVKDLVP